MQNAYPDITDQHREFLQKQGLKVYQPAPLHQSLNPFNRNYWFNNALMFAIAVLGRRHAGKVGSPRILWSAAIVGIPLSAIVARTRLDTLDDITGARKTLEHKLEQAPITRRAWERALQTNTEYQNEIKSQIQELQAEISVKKAQAKN